MGNSSIGDYIVS